MSQVPPVTVSELGKAGAADLTSASEKSVTSSVYASAPAPASASKLRSCLVCRSRKVRCDKLSPCSNCRRANIACVFPSAADRPPRWARRLDRVTNIAASSAKATQEAAPGAGQVMERLHNLESLVKELRGQLEQANAAARSTGGGSSDANSPESSTHNRDVAHQMDTSSTASTTGIQKHFGRLVLQDASQSRYVSTGFWSRVNDEIEGLKMDTRGLAGGESDTSEDEDSPGKTPSTQELERTPSERHAFLFRHNLGPSSPDIRQFYPLPSQIPFLLSVFSENVNFIIQIVHIPTVTKMIRDLRGSDVSSLTPANEALMFSIYYAAVTSMEEDEIMADFGSTKVDLCLKYRLGLEYALAKADFLNVPEIVLVQAFAIFLFLVRRYDSPRFVWMMAGLVIRMAQALGLHRDGSHFDHLTPYEVEIRRRVWWALCLLDLRASEDQGTELTITSGSFDTKLPSNINDADIEPQTKQTPMERQSMTDMTFAVVSYEICDVMRRMVAPGIGEGPPAPEDQRRLLNEIFEKLDRPYLQDLVESENIAYWVALTSTRLVMAKMTLITYLPFLFSSLSEDLSDEIRTKLLVSAIEVAEYNHTLNSEKACRKWRWIFQTYTHWHAIVYLLIEVSRRPWSPIIERAWVALHSSWLIPVQSNSDLNLRIWFPLRKLMTKARKHRDEEVDRLRGDTHAAAQLEIEDGKLPLPGSSGPFPAGKSDDLFRERWRKLVAMPEEAGYGTQPRGTPPTRTVASSNVVNTVDVTQQDFGSVPVFEEGELWSNSNFEPSYIADLDLSSMNTTLDSAVATKPPLDVSIGLTGDLSYNATAVPVDCSGDWSVGSGVLPWLWADTDPSVDVFADLDVNMDLDTEIDWYNWVESAKSMEVNSGAAETSRS